MKLLRISHIPFLKGMIGIIGMLSLSLQASGAPAKPTPIKMTQPDGTEITVTLRGDERGHFYMSEDGLLLLSKDKGLYYAHVDADGQVSPSEVLAHPTTHRSAQELKFISSLDTEYALQRLELQQSSNPRLIKGSERSNPLSQTKSAYKAVSETEHTQSFGLGLFSFINYPAYGSPRNLVILVRYDDVDFSTDEPYDYFNRMLNEPGFSDLRATGSARDYFIACSDSLFQPQFDLYGPVTLPCERSYYGENDRYGNDKRAEMMAVHACEILDDQIDFNDYDCDGDGFIDNVYVIYAGGGEASGAGEDTVWPHSYDVTLMHALPIMFDGVQIDHYACSNEIEYDQPDGIGTFVHEFSHVIGLPDLYPTNYTGAFTPTAWSVLDTGMYNNNSRTPPLYSTFERNALKWLSPTILNKTERITLPPLSQNVGYIIESSSPNEFFLLENRQQEGWDSYLPGHGMLIWHIDYDESIWYQNIVNNSSTHQYVDLVEADNQRTTTTLKGDAWPGNKNKTSFTYSSAPALRTWAKDSLDVEITEIKEQDGLISFLCTYVKPTNEESGISNPTIEDNNNIIVGAQCLKATGNEPVNIYSFDGRLVTTGQPNQWLTVKPGIYIVRQGSMVCKVHVNY